MVEVFDIVKLIETNPLDCLSNDYQSKLLNKIKEQFNNDEQQLFIASFYSYLNYNKHEFIIDLDDIWKWLGFSRKDPAKRLLEKNFENNIDYKITSIQKEKTTPLLGGAGSNKESILMTINTFKELCIKADTNKAKDIRKYFIKLEYILHEIINEEAKELKELVFKQQQEIKNKNEIITKKEQEVILEKEKILLESYHFKNIVYLIHIKNNLYKYGHTGNIKDRLNKHRTDIGTYIRLIYCIESSNNKQLESNLKNYLNLTTTYTVEEHFNNNITTHHELFEIDNNETVIIEFKPYSGIEIITKKLIIFNEDLKDNRALIDDLKKEILKLKEKEKKECLPKDIYIKITNYESKINKLETKVYHLQKELKKKSELETKLNQANLEIAKLKDLLKEKDLKFKQDLKEQHEQIIIDKTNEIITNTIELKEEVTLISSKTDFNLENALEFVEPNLGSRIHLYTILNKLKEFYIINDTDDFRFELIEYLKKHFNIEISESFNFKRFGRCVFKDISLKNHSSFFPNSVYCDFISKYVNIKNRDKNPITKRYLYYVKYHELFKLFNDYIKKNELKKIYNFEMGEIYLFNNEFKKYICKYTNSKLQILTYVKDEFLKYFLGISLKKLIL